ncbi:MAG: hypothetical protein CML14_09110 [Puniceicoccaceae bacterium]|nr:hypothetical protein [Puniceicoccaceae bacterium]
MRWVGTTPILTLDLFLISMAVLNWLEFDEGVNNAGLYTSTIRRLNQGNCLDWQFKSDFFHLVFLIS